MEVCAMRFDKFLKDVAPAIAMAMAAASTAGCDGKFSFNGKQGVPLSELDLSGGAPDTITLAGPDIVRISEGPDFTIAVEGEAEAKERMRFLLEDGTLSIMRGDQSWVDSPRDQATISITMPPPRKLVIAGAGEMHSDILARKAAIVIAGAGTISTPNVAVDSLDVNLAGSGRYRASGYTEELDLNLAGSGRVKLGELKAGRAKVKLAGSGNATFASDGDVDVVIVGSGNVTVRGSATCKVKSLGSGTLTCERGATVVDDEK
jgi:hypothetical protein